MFLEYGGFDEEERKKERKKERKQQHESMKRCYIASRVLAM